MSWIKDYIATYGEADGLAHVDECRAADLRTTLRVLHELAGYAAGRGWTGDAGRLREAIALARDTAASAAAAAGTVDAGGQAAFTGCRPRPRRRPGPRRPGAR